MARRGATASGRSHPRALRDAATPGGRRGSAGRGQGLAIGARGATWAM
ncbi:hypothetical protein BUC_5998 [Burkholderia pseudomallei 576]|nr:hypothetical protein BUC_5998 [Burkholderia pseudomallei 576]